jgi:transcription elongation regulator 1
MSYNEFSQKFSRDERFRTVEKSRDRESYFSEFISELKKKERDVRKMERDKVNE